MSLDILRFYCRLLCRSNGFRETNLCWAFTTHRLSRWNSFAVSLTFLEQTALWPFSSSHGYVRTSYTVLLPSYCRIFRGSFPLRRTSVSFYDKPLYVTCISNAMKPVKIIHGLW